MAKQGYLIGIKPDGTAKLFETDGDYASALAKYKEIRKQNLKVEHQNGKILELKELLLMEPRKRLKA